MELKYSIEEKLQQIAKKDFGLAIRVICQELQISVATLKRYRKIAAKSKATISELHLRQLAGLFACSPESLCNTALDVRPLNFLIEKERKKQARNNLAKKYNLSKPRAHTV